MLKCSANTQPCHRQIKTCVWSLGLLNGNNPVEQYLHTWVTLKSASCAGSVTRRLYREFTKPHGNIFITDIPSVVFHNVLVKLWKNTKLSSMDVSDNPFMKVQIQSKAGYLYADFLFVCFLFHECSVISPADNSEHVSLHVDEFTLTVYELCPHYSLY